METLKILSVLLISFGAHNSFAQNINDCKSHEKFYQILDSLNFQKESHSRLIKALDEYIQNHELTVRQAYLMSDKLFTEKNYKGYDLLIKYNSTFTRYPSLNASELINGKVYIIHHQIRRLDVKEIRPFADYIFNSQLDRKLKKTELDFFKKVFNIFIDEFCQKYSNQKINFSNIKNDNLKLLLKR